MNKNSFQMVFKTVEVKAGKIKITGFASTPEIDRYDDIVKPSAFQNTMEQYMKNPVVLLQHNSDKPIGVVTSYKIVSNGLEVTAEISNDIDNTFKLIQEKILRGFSIGFIAKEWSTITEQDREIREITDVDLVEISVVSTPANAGSLFTLAKSVREFFLTKDKEEKDVEIIDSTEEEVKEEIIESVSPETVAEEVIIPEAETETVETTEEVTEEKETEKTEEVGDVAKEEETTEQAEAVEEEEKNFFTLEKKSVMVSPKELVVGDMVTFKEKPEMAYDPWSGDNYMISDETVRMGEIIKIKADGFVLDCGEVEAVEKGNPIVYISIYKQSLENGLLPTECVCVEEFNELLINRIESQKSIEIKTDDLENTGENPGAETQEEAEVIEAVATEETPEVIDEVEALKEENETLKQEIVSKDEILTEQSETIAEQSKTIADLTEKSVSLEEKMQKVGVRKAKIVSEASTSYGYRALSYNDILKLKK